ncbi:asparagine synthase (glutamine-hydrolyzing) [Novosphingobium gossypii]
MDRFVALVRQRSAASDFEARSACVEAKCQQAGLVPCHHQPGLLILATPNLPVLVGIDGVILGETHARQPAGQSTSPQAGPLAGEVLGRAEHLLARNWGSFVAVLKAEGRDCVEVVRSPFGRLACLWRADDQLIALASDVALLALAGFPRPEVDTAMLAHRLVWPGLSLRETCLAEVRSIPGGNTLEISGNAGRRRLQEGCAWTPWSRAHKAQWYETHEEARDGVRAAIFTAIAGCRKNGDNALLLLSGGIDSSILAATLSSLGGTYSGVNLVRRDGAGDERRFARAVADRLGIQLAEIEWSLADINLSRSESAGQPNPGSRIFMQGTNAAVHRAVTHCGADLVIDGGGGDNVFLGLYSVAPVTDALRCEGLGAALATGRSVATLSQTSLWTVLRRAFVRRFRRSPAFRWQPEIAFLSSDAAAWRAPSPRHPWLVPPPGAETGKAAHVALIAAAQGWAEECDLMSPRRQASPLATVPVVEACLKVPSWWWYEGGRNRAIARQAFEQRLPPEVTMRQTKGSPDGYVAEIYAQHRTTVRAMLLDGELRRRGLLDVAAIDAVTRADSVAIGTSYDRLLQLSQVEAWLSCRV